MNTQEVITCLLKLVAGIGVFLIACDMTSENLQAISSDKLKDLFSKVMKNKIAGVAVGAGATAAIQSSSATVVMIIGFVNAGILTLNQAAPMIFGGEIGTTITGQIVALGLISGEGVDVSVIFASLAGIGVLASMFVKDEKIKRILGILSGVGVLFVGLTTMSDAMKAFAQLDSLKTFLASVDNIILIILIGALLTAVIQSSAAMTSIAITMVIANLITLEQGIYITLGANVGTCITGMIAGMSSQSNAKRTALIQLIFNVAGVVILAALDGIAKVVSGNTISVGILFSRIFVGQPQTQLAMFHTVFNIASVIVALPLSDALVNLTKRMIKDDEKAEEYVHFYFFDEHMLTTPALAIDQVKKEIIHMGKTAIENFNIAIDTILNIDFKNEEKFKQNELQLNFVNQNLVKYIVELANQKISHKDYVYLSSTYRAISDFERIGDYSENVVEYAHELQKNNESFSKEARKEVEELKGLVNSLYEITIDIYNSGDRITFLKARIIEEKIDALTKDMADNHIKRLNTGNCNAVAGAQYLKLSSDVERIGDHLININDKDYELSH